MPKHFSVSSVLVLVMIGCCSFAACRRVAPPEGLLQRQIAHPLVSGHQLRVMVNEFVVYSAHRIELRADEILAEANDSRIQKNALRWKINGIPACFQAGSRHDPLGAYLDLWVLNRQMLHLSESPDGQALFGLWQTKIAAEYLELDERLQAISKTVSSDLPTAEKFVDKFATDFPLKGLYFDREPIASRYIEEIQTPSTELFQVVANLDNNIDELKKLTILYAEHLPKQARWEAELFLVDTSQSYVFQRPLQDFARVTDALAQIADTTQKVPHLVENERRVLSEMVTVERRATLDGLEQMRQATVAQFETERSIVLATLQRERETILASLRDERTAVLDEFNTRMSEALRATDAITEKRSRELVQQAPNVIDHFFWRAMQIGLVALSLIALLAVYYAQQTTKLSTSKPALDTLDTAAPETARFARIDEYERRRAA